MDGGETAGEQWPFETAPVSVCFFSHSASVVAAAFSEGKATAHEKGDKHTCIAAHRSGTALPTFLPTHPPTRCRAARSRSRSFHPPPPPNGEPCSAVQCRAFGRPLSTRQQPCLTHSPFSTRDRNGWYDRPTTAGTATERGAIRWTVVAAHPPFVSAAARDPSALLRARGFGTRDWRCAGRISSEFVCARECGELTVGWRCASNARLWSLLLLLFSVRR